MGGGSNEGFCKKDCRSRNKGVLNDLTCYCRPAVGAENPCITRVNRRPAEADEKELPPPTAAYCGRVPGAADAGALVVRPAEDWRDPEQDRRQEAPGGSPHHPGDGLQPPDPQPAGGDQRPAAAPGHGAG